MEHFFEEKSKRATAIRWILGNPWKTLAISFLVLGLMAPQMKNIDADFSYRTWFRDGDVLLNEFDAFERRFGNDDAIVVVVHSENGVFDIESTELLNKLTADMWQVNEVIRVDSLSNYNWVYGEGDSIIVEPLLEPAPGVALTNEFLQARKQLALNDETIPGYLVSEDAKSAVMFARIKPAIVNYKQVIQAFQADGMRQDNRSSTFSTLMEENGVFQDDSGSLFEEDLMEEESDLEASLETSENPLMAAFEIRDQYYSDLIDQIVAREKVLNTLINYEDVLDIISKAQPASYSTLADNPAIEQPVRDTLQNLSSADLEELLVVLKQAEKGKSANYESIVRNVKEVLANYQGQGHDFYINGGVYLSDSFRDATIKDMSVMMPLSMVLIIAFLFLSFRHFSGIVLAMSVVITTIIFVLSLMGLTGFRFNNLTSIIPQIMLAICIADAVHILASYYMFLKRGADRYKSAFLSLMKNFNPTLFTAISTAFGFFSFATAKVDPIASLGILAGIGTLVAWVLSYTVLGPLLVIMPARQRKGEVNQEEIEAVSPRAERYSKVIFQRRKPIIAGTTALALAAIFMSSQHIVNSDPFSYFREGTDLKTSLEFLEENVGSAMGFELSIDSGSEEGIKDPDFLNRVNELRKWISVQAGPDGQPYVTKTVSIVEILKTMNRTLNGGDQEYYALPTKKEFVGEHLFMYTMNLPTGMDINDRMTLKNDAIRMTVLHTLHDSVRVLDAADQIKAKGRELGLEISITGKQVLYQALNPYVVSTFIVSISLAVLFVSIILMIGFRSVKLGLLAMVPNAIPLLFGSAFIYSLGNDLDMGTVIVFSVCLGIAVDDTIHFLENYRVFRKEGYNPEQAISRVMTFTVPALTTTTAILIVGFGIFVLASFVPNINFGVYSSLMLGIALLADITFLPALLTYLKPVSPDDTAQS